ncbi:hypothetical protein ACUN22_35865 [Streptomyces anulatus]
MRIDDDIEHEALAAHAAFLASPGTVELSSLAEPPADQDRNCKMFGFGP